MPNAEDGNEGCTLNVTNSTGKVMTLTANNLTEGDWVSEPATTLKNGDSTNFSIKGASGSMTGCSGNFTYTINDTGSNPVTIAWSYAKPYDGNNSFNCVMGGSNAGNYSTDVSPAYSPGDYDWLTNTTTVSPS